VLSPLPASTDRTMLIPTLFEGVLNVSAITGITESTATRWSKTNA
jgi:hypothetical protein